ncbi:DUF1971 domain-containing protein [Emcibacter sp. SYSU 3D8]|uniref:DUF1971 domain-containing protein n=1 Tax=Emcibacter sp. SYSU 3D8 TaxID=3133969 RepID=UPI0031FF32EE
MTSQSPLTTRQLGELVDRFYARVRADELIGPVFNNAVGNWPDHLEKLTRFWSSVMLRSGTYSGNPAAEHIKHAGTITPEMFDRWLALWTQTTTELLPPAHALELQRMASRIAESLKSAIKFHLGQPIVAEPGSRARPGGASKPYRSTAIFDQDTLPQALRREHSTKAGTWGVIRVLSGKARLHLAAGGERTLSQNEPGIVEPEQVHWVEPLGPMRLQVDFHASPPVL